MRWFGFTKRLGFLAKQKRTPGNLYLISLLILIVISLLMLNVHIFPKWNNVANRQESRQMLCQQRGIRLKVIMTEIKSHNWETCREGVVGSSQRNVVEELVTFRKGGWKGVAGDQKTWRRCKNNEECPLLSWHGDSSQDLLLSYDFHILTISG